MDSRVELTNAISGLILADYKDIRTIRARVKHFDSLLDDSLRNFYEIKIGNDVPLFALCDYLNLGKDNYGLTEEEYNQKLDDLVYAISRMFGVTLTLWC